MTAPVPEPNPAPAPAPTPPEPGPNPTPPPPPQGPTVLSLARSRRYLERLAVAGLSRVEAIRYLARRGMLVPVAGGSPEGDDGGDGGTGGGTGGDGGKGGTGDGGDGGKGGDGGTGGDGGGQWTPPTREEFEAQQKALAEANKRARTLERQQSEAQRKAAEEAGNFEELHKQSSAELDRVKGLVSKAAIRDAVAEVAARLRFRNPNIAHRLIELDGIEATLELDGDEPTASVDSASKGMIERRLTEVAEREAYLLGEPAAGQLAGAGANRGAGGTGSGGGQGDGNAAMNAAIRRAAGRA